MNEKKKRNIFYNFVLPSSIGNPSHRLLEERRKKMDQTAKNLGRETERVSPEEHGHGARMEGPGNDPNGALNDAVVTVTEELGGIGATPAIITAAIPAVTSAPAAPSVPTSSSAGSSGSVENNGREPNGPVEDTQSSPSTSAAINGSSPNTEQEGWSPEVGAGRFGDSGNGGGGGGGRQFLHPSSSQYAHSPPQQQRRRHSDNSSDDEAGQNSIDTRSRWDQHRNQLRNPQGRRLFDGSNGETRSRINDRPPRLVSFQDDSSLSDSSFPSPSPSTPTSSGLETPGRRGGDKERTKEKDQDKDKGKQLGSSRTVTLVVDGSRFPVTVEKLQAHPDTMLGRMFSSPVLKYVFFLLPSSPLPLV